MKKGKSEMQILIEESLKLREELIQATRSLEKYAHQLAETSRLLEEGDSHEQSDTGGE